MKKNQVADQANKTPMMLAAKASPMRGMMFWVVMLNAVAFMTNSGGTIAGIAALLAGMKNERTLESANAVANSSQMGGFARKITTAQRRQRVSPLMMSDRSMILRRSIRSATTPAYGLKSRNGKASTAPTKPTIGLEPVMCSTMKKKLA